MAFDKTQGCPKRKDWRKPYYKKPQQNCRGCRHGGHCDWCREDRLHKRAKAETVSQEKLREATE